MSTDVQPPVKATDPLGSLRIVGLVVVGLAVTVVALPFVLYFHSRDDKDQEADYAY